MNRINDSDDIQEEVQEYLLAEKPIPRVCKIGLVFLCIFVATMLAGMIFAVIYLARRFEIDLWFYILSFAILIILFFEVGLRVIAIYSVKCYQRYTRKEIRMQCICKPTCSEYAIGVFKKYLFLHALYKIHIRLHYTCTGGRYKINLP